LGSVVEGAAWGLAVGAMAAISAIANGRAQALLRQVEAQSRFRMVREFYT
jgi:hypothetical protein